MADQTLRINVETSADTAPLADFNTQMQRMLDLEKQLPGIPAELTNMPVAAKAAATEVKSLADQFNEAGGSFAKARAELITLFRELASGGNVTRTFGALMSALPTGIGAAAVALFVLGRAIFAATKEQEKLREEMAKGEEALARQATAWQRMATTAVSQKEVISLAEQLTTKLEESNEALNKVTRQAAEQWDITRGIKAIGDIIADVVTAENVWDAADKLRSEKFLTSKDKEVEAALKLRNETVQQASANLQQAEATSRIADQQERSRDRLNFLADAQAALVRQMAATDVQTESGKNAFAELAALLQQVDGIIKIVTSDMEKLGGALERLVDKDIAKIQEQLKRENQQFIDQQNYIAETNDRINEWNAAGNKQAEIAAKVAAEIRKVHDAMKAKGASDADATALANQAGAALQNQLNVQQAAKTSTDQLTASMTKLREAMQQIHQTQTLIKDTPFLMPDQRQAILMRSMADEAANLVKQIQELQRQKDLGGLDAAKLASVNKELDTARFNLADLRLKMAGMGNELLSDLSKWASSFGTTMHQISGVIEGTINKSLDALNQYLLTGKFNAQELLKSFVEMGLKLIEQMAIQQVMAFINSKISQGIAATTASGISATMAPAATLTTIATEGEAAAQAPAAIAAAVGMVEASTAMTGGGGLFGGMQKGGFITGQYEGGDTVPAMLAPGEYVIRRDSVKKLGLATLDALNAYAAGGVVTSGRHYYQEAVSRHLPFAQLAMSPFEFGRGDFGEFGPQFSRYTAMSMAMLGTYGGWGTSPWGGLTGATPAFGPTMSPTSWINYPGVGYVPMGIPLFTENVLQPTMQHATSSHVAAHAAGGLITRAKFATGGRVNGSMGNMSSGNVHVYNFTDPKAMVSHMATQAGQKIIVDTVHGRRIDLGFTG